ncbi:hypothetical protein LT493_11630 [Streptomyces tricolor]|nr:hypothetical protein [Streptomyces tricolor]
MTSRRWPSSTSRGVALGIAEAVEWYGQVWRRDLVLPLLTTSQVFVSASRFEEHAHLHPGSHGRRPAVGPLRHLLSPRDGGEAGLYFAPDKPGELAAALEGLAADAHRRKELGETSLERSGLFDLDRFTDRHLQVYRRVSGR